MPTFVETIVVKNPETIVKIKTFSPEQRVALEKLGFVIYSLTGQSIRDLRESGHKFFSTWHRHSSLFGFEALESMKSEVAINPNKLFLPESNNKTLPEQERMVERFSQELAMKVRDVKAIMGQAPDYAELAFAHSDATKECLFGERYGYNWARTKTPILDSCVAIVGYFFTDFGLRVNFWDADLGYGIVHAVPLVVPASPELQRGEPAQDLVYDRIRKI